jgi:hypothetical protein
MTGEVDRPVSEFERDPVLAAITTASDEPIDWIRAGQALERVHLTATARDLALSYLGQPFEVGDRWWATGPIAGISGIPHMILRLGYAAPSAPTPRRPIDDVLREGRRSVWSNRRADPSCLELSLGLPPIRKRTARIKLRYRMREVLHGVVHVTSLCHCLCRNYPGQRRFDGEPQLVRSGSRTQCPLNGRLCRACVQQHRGNCAIGGEWSRTQSCTLRSFFRVVRRSFGPTSVTQSQVASRQQF